MSAAAPQSRRDQQREETRERIFQAAVAEFLAVGYAKAQIPRIAAAAGVVRGTFYFHFPSKEHVLSELGRRAGSEMAQKLDAARARGVPLAEALSMLAEPVAVLDESPAGLELMRDMVVLFVRGPVDEGIDEEGEEFSEIGEAVSAYLAHAVAGGELRGDLAPDRLARMVLSSLLGVIMSHRDPDTDRRAEVRAVIDLLLRGMRVG